MIMRQESGLTHIRALKQQYAGVIHVDYITKQACNIYVKGANRHEAVHIKQKDIQGC